MTWQRLSERCIELFLFSCALLSVVTTVAIILVLFSEAVYSLGGGKAFFQIVSPVEFFLGTKWSPSFSQKSFGILPLLSGTLLIAGIAAVIGLPIGILSAVWLSEYASPRFRNVVKPVMEILAGVPTVVYGFFALQFLTPVFIKPVFEGWLGWEVEGYNALSAGIVVGIMIIPMVASLSEDALRAVPRSLREAGYALGSTKYHVSVHVVLPAATSGIIASFLLAVSRAIGETMAVAIAAGQSPVLSINPLRSVQTMTAFMVSMTGGEAAVGSIENKSLYAVGLTLFCMTLLMNVFAQIVMRRFREVYQ